MIPPRNLGLLANHAKMMFSTVVVPCKSSTPTIKCLKLQVPSQLLWRVGWGGQGGCERTGIEVFVKIQKKKFFFFLGGKGVGEGRGIGMGGGGSGWM